MTEDGGRKTVKTRMSLVAWIFLSSALCFPFSTAPAYAEDTLAVRSASYGGALAETPLSLSQYEVIQRQFAQCMRLPQRSQALVIIEAFYGRDGTLLHTEFPPAMQKRFINHRLHALAEDVAAAMRSPACNPLQGVAPEAYTSWQQLEFSFNTTMLPLESRAPVD